MEIDSFLSYLKNIKRYSALTITAYKEDLNQFREFCEKVELIRQDEEITSKMVRRFEMGLMSGGNMGTIRCLSPFPFTRITAPSKSTSSNFNATSSERLIPV